MIEWQSFPNQMSLDTSCRELQEIAALLVEEHQLIRCMRAEGKVPTVEEEARAYSGGISQIYCLTGPLLIEALNLEMAAALVT